MEYLDIKLLDWPPYSPDLNVIEIIWAIMEKRVEEQNPQTFEDLKRVVQAVWNELSLTTINGLIAEMPNRLNRVIEKQGYTI